MSRGGAERQTDANLGRPVRHGVGDDGVDADGREQQERRAEDDEHPRRNPAEKQILLDVFGERAHVVHRQRRIEVAHDALDLRGEKRFRAGAGAQMHLAPRHRAIAV